MSNTPLPRIAYSTIADGNMSVTWGPEKEVVESRKRFLEKHGLRLEHVVILDLAHDETIVVVDRTAAGTYVRAEAVLTKEAGLPLMLLTADCNPVVLYDPAHSILAIAHLSWQTATLHLAEKTIHKMVQTFGTEPKDLEVTIGPSARKESYIQEEVKQKENPGWAPHLTDVPSGTSIDVLGFVIAQVVSAGVLKEHISVDPTDTITSPNYFSHYRSVRTGEKEGRFATIVVLE